MFISHQVSFVARGPLLDFFKPVFLQFHFSEVSMQIIRKGIVSGVWIFALLLVANDLGLFTRTGHRIR